MAKSDHEPEDTKPAPAPAPAWGTWEELLLSYAVNRYGTKNWDSISSELQKRTPVHMTPVHCQQKYSELKRRFNHPDAADDEIDVTVPWLEELRTARVTELQRELHNYDLYISSLQLKVKKLTEENEINGVKMLTSELGHTQNEIKQMTVEPVASDSVSDRDNQSVNGSNGNVETGVEKSGTGVEKSETEPEGGEPVGGEPVEPGRGEPDGEVSEAPESIAESKSEGKNSDVQSSASKRKEKRGGVKSEMDELSTDSVPVRSLPLVDFLQKLHKIGSAVLEPRLDRQEKLRYKSLIRHYIDYETLQTRLKDGWYSDGNDIFFRDLLLVVSNARIFFPKESPESIAAGDLRQLILKEMLLIKKQKLDTKPTDKQTSLKSSNVPPKQVNEPDDSLLLKPKLTGPIVVCRKRSSITAKAAGSKTSDKVTDETPKKSRDSFNLLAKKKGKSPVNETSETKPEKKKKLTEAEEKKQSAAKFLNRMKRSNEPLLSSLKSSSDRGGSENDSKSGNKGGSSGGGDGKRDQAGKKSSGGRQTKEADSPAKRSVGRPPKRAAVLGKRNREPAVDSETLDSKQTNKKRSKR